VIWRGNVATGHEVGDRQRQRHAKRPSATACAIFVNLPYDLHLD